MVRCNDGPDENNDVLPKKNQHLVARTTMKMVWHKGHETDTTNGNKRTAKWQVTS